MGTRTRHSAAWKRESWLGSDSRTAHFNTKLRQFMVHSFDTLECRKMLRPSSGLRTRGVLRGPLKTSSLFQISSVLVSDAATLVRARGGLHVAFPSSTFAHG